MAYQENVARALHWLHEAALALGNAEAALDATVLMAESQLTADLRGEVEQLAAKLVRP